jgi:hypothetical protein
MEINTTTKPPLISNTLDTFDLVQNHAEPCCKILRIKVEQCIRLDLLRVSSNAII